VALAAPARDRVGASAQLLDQAGDVGGDGAPEPAMQSPLELSRDGRYDLDFDRLQRMIDAARKEGR
jgi:hypothetical protein